MKKLLSNHFTSSFLFVCLLIGLANACKKSSDNYNSSSNNSSSPGTNEVWIQGNAFNPSTISVAVNTTIKWTNKDGVNHTVTSDDGAFTSSGTISSGGTFSRQFTAVDTLPYHCNFHSGMTGKVIVHN